MQSLASLLSLTTFLGAVSLLASGSKAHEGMMNMPSNGIDCVVTSWVNVGACNASCGGGVLFQVREVITHPSNGGKACPELERTLQCNPQPCVSPYRSYDRAESTGAVNTPFVRYLEKTQYEDSAGSLVGENRPSARFLSNSLFSKVGEKPSINSSLLAMYFAQFINYDMVDFDHASASCLKEGESAPIRIPQGDPWYAAIKEGTIPYKRSSYCLSSEQGKDRHQYNGATSFIDASSIYGVDPAQLALRRTMREGEFKLTSDGLPPTIAELGLPSYIQTCNDPSRQCLAFGDQRLNENQGLLALGVLFIKEHNSWAKKLAFLNPSWSDEVVFQEARKRVIGELQAIVFEEFLPSMVGSSCPSQNEHDALHPDASAQIPIEYVSVMGLVHYVGLSSSVHYRNIRGEILAEIEFDERFQSPAGVNETYLALLLKSMADQMAERIEPGLMDHLRNPSIPSVERGQIDLAARFIHMGRDHGLVSYNDMRRAYSLPRIASFAQITSNKHLALRLKSAYSDIEQMDALVGAMAEDAQSDTGSIFGPLLTEIFCSQMMHAQVADSYFYEKDLGLSKDEIDELRKTTLASVITANFAQVHHGEVRPAAFKPNAGGDDNSGPVDCLVGEWKNMGACSRPCGEGKQKQIRSIVTHPFRGGKECPVLYRVVPCNEHECDGGEESDGIVDCKVSEWSAPEECTKSCGGGIRQQFRYIITNPTPNGKQCPALYRHFPCNSQPCNFVEVIAGKVPVRGQKSRPIVAAENDTIVFHIEPHCKATPIIHGEYLVKCRNLQHNEKCEFQSPRLNTTCYLTCLKGRWSPPNCPNYVSVSRERGSPRPTNSPLGHQIVIINGGDGDEEEQAPRRPPVDKERENNADYEDEDEDDDNEEDNISEDAPAKSAPLSTIKKQDGLHFQESTAAPATPMLTTKTKKKQSQQASNTASDDVAQSSSFLGFRVTGQTAVVLLTGVVFLVVVGIVIYVIKRRGSTYKAAPLPRYLHLKTDEPDGFSAEDFYSIQQHDDNNVTDVHARQGYARRASAKWFI